LGCLVWGGCGGAAGVQWQGGGFAEGGGWVWAGRSGKKKCQQELAKPEEKGKRKCAKQGKGGRGRAQGPANRFGGGVGKGKLYNGPSNGGCQGERRKGKRSDSNGAWGAVEGWGANGTGGGGSRKTDSMRKNDGTQNRHPEQRCTRQEKAGGRGWRAEQGGGKSRGVRLASPRRAKSRSKQAGAPPGNGEIERGGWEERAVKSLGKGKSSGRAA